MSHPSPELDVEHQRPHEIVRDEDVLSLSLQHEFEAVGSAIGLVAAVALVASHVARATRLLRARAGVTGGAGGDGARHG